MALPELCCQQAEGQAVACGGDTEAVTAGQPHSGPCASPSACVGAWGRVTAPSRAQSERGARFVEADGSSEGARALGRHLGLC